MLSSISVHSLRGTKTKTGSWTSVSSFLCARLGVESPSSSHHRPLLTSRIPAAATATTTVNQEQVPEYEDLATKYNLLARREAKRRAPSAAGSTSVAAAAVSTEALAELIRRQNEILLDIRAELSAMRERSGAGTPQVEDSDVYEDDYGFDPEGEGGAD